MARPSGAMEAQMQIRQNATEVQEYMADLFDWQKGMKKADKSVQSRATDPSRVAESHSPAPRGRAASKVGEAPPDLQRPGLPLGSKPSSGPSTSSGAKPKDLKSDHKLAGTAAAHTYSSYSKWDKLNLDGDSDEEGTVSGRKVVEKVKKPEVAKPPAAAASRPVELQAAAAVVPMPRVEADGSVLPPIRNQEPQTPEEWRVRGNALFKVGQFASARECYTRSIMVEPSCLAYANRAMVEIKLQNWQAAEDDCSEALLLDPSYTKGHHRRGTARRNQGKHLEAAEDFDAALRCKPSSKGIQAERDAELASYMAANKLQPLSKRTKLAVKVIHHGGATSSGQGVGTAAAAAAAAAAVPSGPTSGGLASSERASSAASASKRQMPAMVIPVISSQPKTVPKTSLDFENAWRSIAGDVALQAAYLSLIDPMMLPSIFKTSLTGPVLSSLVRSVLLSMSSAALCDSSTSGTSRPEGHATEGSSIEGSTKSVLLASDFCVSFLSHLCKVQRFDMTAMCLTAKDKVELRGLWDSASAQAAGKDAEMAELRKKFRL